jgi:thymidylate synthase
VKYCLILHGFFVELSESFCRRVLIPCCGGTVFCGTNSKNNNGGREEYEPRDEVFIANCRDILENGVWDTDREVRPRWEDGAPAHTIKKFGIVNRYDLSKEFPILTLRRTYWKSAIDELLWIWQAKSNNVRDLRTRVWDAWADENGSIGKAYGYQLGVKHHYPEGDMDQVDKVIWDLKHNPASRRIMTNIYNFADLSEMALYPCAYSMTFNVSGNTLNAILNQRSQDMLAANNWNVVQYSVLTMMMAQISGLQPGRAHPRHRGRPHLRPPCGRIEEDNRQPPKPAPAVPHRPRGGRFL